MRYVDSALIGILAAGGPALLAVSITLMFRTTGVLSFAHAAFATLAAFLYTDLAVDRGLPVGIAAVVTMAVILCFGVLVEALVIRRVSESSGVVKLIATLGVFAATTGVVNAAFGSAPSASPFLMPRGTVTISGLAFPNQQVALTVLAVGVTAALTVFLRRSAFGVAIRAVAVNREAAALIGIAPARVARFNWALAALISGAVGILSAPLALFNVTTYLLISTEAFTASLLGGLASLPIALLAALGLGAVDGVLPNLVTTPGTKELILLALIVGVLTVGKRWLPEAPAAEVTFSGTTGPRRLTGRLGELADRAQGRITRLVRPASGLWPLVLLAAMSVLAMLVVLPARDEFNAAVASRGVFIAIQALAVVVITGWAGQVSLMQGAYAGMGAFVTSYLGVTHGWPLEIVIPVAGAATMLLGLIVGIPALRLSSLQFAIASVVFAAAAAAWLFQRGGASSSVPRGTLFGIDLFDTGALYLVMLVVAAVFFLLAWNIKRSTYGSLLLVSRDAPQAVSHFGTRPARVRMGAFLFASFISGVGGAFYVMLITFFNPFDFSILLSLLLLVYAVVGGLQSLAGPLIAAAAFGVGPALMQQGGGQAKGGASFELLSGLLLLALIASRPAGLASLLRRRSDGPSSETSAPAHGVRYGRFDLVMRDRDRPAGAPPNGTSGEWGDRQARDARRST
jgi:branched-chain amino acid transport system permease protein